MLDERNEILIRGPSVFSGYEIRKHMDEDPNISSRKGSWFCTGDRGHMDDNGYLTITGRFKETILRGGEKISPLVVEDSIVDARVLDKAAFPVAHEELGEVVGLAVVTSAAEADLGSLLASIKKHS